MSEKRRYAIGYEISGHIIVEANNPQAAAAEAGAYVRSAARSLPGDQEYRVPYGDVIDLRTLSRKRPKP
jgi:hypothetical protein